MTRHTLYLAWRAWAAHPVRAALLVLALTLALVLPGGVALGLDRAGRALTARALASPVLVGRPGDGADLVLAALYFRGAVRTPLRWDQREALVAGGYGPVLPLYVRHSAGGAPVVGTRLEYLDARGLQVAEGRRFAVLGEVVAGAELAAAFDLRPGDTVQSDPRNLYDIAGAWPLALTVAGVLAPRGTPDDGAFFADLSTTWALDGSLHGHEALPSGDPDEVVQAPAALFLASEVTPQNRGSFHLHGDPGAQPLTALLVLPRDARRHDQLLGDLAMREDLVAVRPVEVVRALLDALLRARRGLDAAFLLGGLSTLALVGLVLQLGLRARREELALLARIGASRRTVAAVLLAELGLLLGAALALSAALLGGLAHLLRLLWGG